MCACSSRTMPTYTLATATETAVICVKESAHFACAYVFAGARNWHLLVAFAGGKRQRRSDLAFTSCWQLARCRAVRLEARNLY